VPNHTAAAGTWISNAVVAMSWPASDDACPVTNGGSNANTDHPASASVVAHRNVIRTPTATTATTTAVTSHALGSSKADNKPKK
jgi:hypothetical protein